jgi:hypothetical protein
MQHLFRKHATAAGAPMNDDLISISAAARSLGLAPSTLSRQVADGKVRCHEGKRVRLSEVVADRKANVAYPVGISAPRSPIPDANHQDEDDEPIGPEPFTTITDIPLTRGLLRRLAEMIGTENPHDFAEVGLDLVHIGGDILVQTIEHQRTMRWEITKRSK